MKKIEFNTDATEQELHCKGIYEIINTENGKRYIGSTMDSFRSRWQAHKRDLICGCHTNAHLQQAWQKYGESAFVFRILKILPRNSSATYVLKNEQQYIDMHSPEELYNICMQAGNTAGVKQSSSLVLKKSKRYVFVDPNNNIYDVVGMRNFCREHGLQQSHIVNVANGKMKHYKGWLVYHAEDFSKERLINDRIALMPKIYSLTHESGQNVVTTDIGSFAKAHNLSATCLYNAAVKRNGRASHRGWTCEQL